MPLTKSSIVQPALLSKINERQVLRVIQARGPMSRADVARHSGISAPTASKAVESLLRAGLLEEGAAPELARGRPAKRLHLASESAQVLGLVIDAERCRIVSAALDGKIQDLGQFDTPETYEQLIDLAVVEARRLMDRAGVTTLGLAISTPGLIDYRHQKGVLSPNVPITNGHSPARDLAAPLDIPCVMIQETHALCLAERQFGHARGLEDFAVLDISTGIGLGVMSGGRLLTGHAGMAGEIGHVTMELDGRACGCGNRGCLETVASDSALAYAVSKRLGRKMSVDEVIEGVHSGQIEATEELRRTGRYLAVGLAAAINLFNPSFLFVHGRLFEADPELFPRVVEEAGKRALPPSFRDCKIVQAQGSKRQGAVAAIIEHLTESVVPVESRLHRIPASHGNAKR
jgi:predicted NBD/HSP70 family sugar kinase